MSKEDHAPHVMRQILPGSRVYRAVAPWDIEQTSHGGEPIEFPKTIHKSNHAGCDLYAAMHNEVRESDLRKVIIHDNGGSRVTYQTNEGTK